MNNLQYELRQLCQRNRDGSHSTQANRAHMLSLAARELYGLGFKGLRAANLAPKHVEALVEHWAQKGLGTATVKNRLATLRWWAEKLNRANVVPRDNVTLGVARRSYSDNIDKGRDLTPEQLARITSDHARASLQLAQAFGLRMEESLKIRPRQADGGNVLELQGSWTKGGRPREVSITHEAQRDALDFAKRVAGEGSLIPTKHSYRSYVSAFRAQLQRAGIDGMHALRHRFAQELYRHMTGWDCPARAGPKVRELSGEQRSIDRRVRLEISLELGHNRIDITSRYLGR